MSGYLAQINFKSSELYLSCNRKTPRSIRVSVPVDPSPKKEEFLSAAFRLILGLTFWIGKVEGLNARA